MKYSRRDFIKLGSFVVGLIPGLAGPGFGVQTPRAIFSQNFDVFRSLIGSQFTFYRSDSATYAVLSDVKNFKSPGKNKNGECISLGFEMPSDDFVQDCYEMYHPEIGAFELMSVPGISENGNPLLIATIGFDFQSND